MELRATRDSSFEDEVPASLLPPREPAPASLLSEEDPPPAPPAVDDELSFRDEALRVESGPPQVLDFADLAFHDESQRVASDPPQYLDVAELALHDESQRIDSDPPQPLDLAVLDLADQAPGSQADERSPSPAAAPKLQAKPRAPTLATPGVGPLPPERGALVLKVTPRVGAGAPAPRLANRPVGGTTEPEEGEAIGTPLRPRKLLAPREAGSLPEIDAELIPDEVHEEFATRRASQDLSVAERQARTKQAHQRSALVIGGVFAIGALMLQIGSGPGAFLVFLCDVAAGAATGWYLGTKRPNRLVGAITAWGAALGLGFVHVAIALGLYGPSSLLALFFPLVLFQALAALSGMFLSTHLESLEFDQSI